MKRGLVFVIVGLLAVQSAAAAEPAAEATPPFPNISLHSLDGETTADIASFRGRPVLLSFWASWCGPCRTELPELERLYAELVVKGFVLLTVSVDHSPAAALRFLKSTGLTVPVYRVDQADLRRLGINSIPTNILIDGDGRTVRVYSGYAPTVAQEIRRVVEHLHEETMQRREAQ